MKHIIHFTRTLFRKQFDRDDLSGHYRATYIIMCISGSTLKGSLCKNSKLEKMVFLFLSKSARVTLSSFIIMYCTSWKSSYFILAVNRIINLSLFVVKFQFTSEPLLRAVQTGYIKTEFSVCSSSSSLFPSLQLIKQRFALLYFSIIYVCWVTNLSFPKIQKPFPCSTCRLKVLSRADFLHKCKSIFSTCTASFNLFLWTF